MKKVSVIITTYGKPVYLKNAIMSVLNQTYINIQLIVVDDNNNDTVERRETERLIDELFKRKKFEYYTHEYNLNGASARNTGIKYAVGEYISFLDSDDEYMPDRVQTIVNLLDGSNYEGAYTGCLFMYKNRIKKMRFAKSGNFLFKTLCTTFNFHTGSNIFVKREVLDELHGFDTDFIRHQDYEFLVRFFSNGYNLLGISKILVIKNNLNTNLPNPERMRKVKDLFLAKYRSEINSFSKAKQRIIINENRFQILIMHSEKSMLKTMISEFIAISLGSPFLAVKKFPKFLYKFIIIALSR